MPDKPTPKLRGRPVKKPMPEPIPDTPENIARALLTTPPKKEDEWDYLNRDRHHGRGQSLSRGALLAGAQRPLRPPGRGHRLGLRGFAGTLKDILCAQEDRVVAGDNTVRYKNRTLQIPADRHRHHYVKAQVRPDGHRAVFHGPRSSR